LQLEAHDHQIKQLSHGRLVEPHAPSPRIIESVENPKIMGEIY
jgi:hypothetical protein